MSYIGNSPTYQAFVTDQFSGTGSQVAFTMSVAPANPASVLVAVSGVLQDPSTYGVSGTTLTFTAAPPSGTGNISVRYLGIPASNITTAAYRTVTELTATAGQTVFTPASYTAGYINVYRNGVLLGSADYTATNGTTVTLAVACIAGELVSTESFYVSSVIGAIPATAGAVTNSYLGTITTLPASGSNTITVPAATGTMSVLTSTQSTVRVDTTNGYGSTNTAIRRFTNIRLNQGSDITYADSATLGASFTINTTGVYAISYSDSFASSAYLGISLNSTQLSTSILSITVTNIVTLLQTNASGSGAVAATLLLTAGDVIRPHTSINGTGVSVGFFTIVRVL
jgi:hypothetical protein